MSDAILDSDKLLLGILFACGHHHFELILCLAEKLSATFGGQILKDVRF